MTGPARAGGERAPTTATGSALVVGLAATLFVAVVASWLVRAFPFVHMESATYLANALDGRAPLVQILDVQRNDFGLYQARELSYATDWLDARAVAWWYTATGRFLPISVVHVFAMGAIACGVTRWLQARAPRLGVAALVPALLFVTSASTLLGARHFRTAKSLAAVAFVLLLLRLARWLAVGDGRETDGSTSRTGGAAVALALAALVLVLADRQGTFFLLLLALLIWRVAPGSAALLALVCALAAGTVYDLWIGPWLIERVAHQQVNWSLQSGTVEIGALLQPAIWRGAMTWLLDSVGIFAGAFGVLWGALVLGAGVALAWVAGGRSWAFRAMLAVLALAGFAALLKSRHPPIDAPEVRVAYYNAPLLAALTVGLALVLARIADRPWWERARPGVLAAALLLAGCNLAALPRFAGRIASGADAGYIPVTTALVGCIERDGGPDPLDQLPRDVAWIGRYHRLCDRYRSLRPTR